MKPNYIPLLLLAVSFAGMAAAAAAAAAGVGDGEEYHRHRAGGGLRPAAAREGEASVEYWRQAGQQWVRDRAQAAGGGGGGGGGAARNVVVFLGDGMSVTTLAAARALQAGEHHDLSFDTFPTVGLTKTYCVDAQVPDSACTATAYLCGVKTNQGLLGVGAAVGRGDCAASLRPDNQADSIAAWALADGRDAGIVTNTRVTHASPAGAFATSANRNWESDVDVRAAGHDPAVCPDIAHQLVHGDVGSRFKVILGGGRREFLPNDTRDEEGELGRRTDGRDLIAEWAAGKRALGATYSYVWNRSALAAVAQEPSDFLLGLFGSSHMRYHLEAPDTEPSLAELTEAAIAVLAPNPRGFFLFVEGGRIDHAHHDNYARLALDETLEFSKAVQRATELLDTEDTLIVVTADHSHVMTYNGMSPRGNDILSPTGSIAQDNLPYMTLSYTNGPGARPRVDYTTEPDYGSLRWRSPADVPLPSETHGGEDVAVFAAGPHHGVFSGAYEQSHLPHLMAYAACLGEGPTACSAAPPLTRLIPLTPLVAILLAIKIYL